MTNDEMRIVIAEKCGWKLEHSINGSIRWVHINRSNSMWYEQDSLSVNGILPNYPNDLNVMHEAEKTLSDGQYIHFRDCLSEMAKVSGATGRWIADNLRIKHSATARQRAEAFIKTICPEKWKGNE